LFGLRRCNGRSRLGHGQEGDVRGHCFRFSDPKRRTIFRVPAVRPPEKRSAACNALRGSVSGGWSGRDAGRPGRQYQRQRPLPQACGPSPHRPDNSNQYGTGCYCMRCRIGAVGVQAPGWLLPCGIIVQLNRHLAHPPAVRLSSQLDKPVGVRPCQGELWGHCFYLCYPLDRIPHFR
jgi:hypothetical protein